MALVWRAGVASGAVDMGGDWRVRIASAFIPGGVLELDFHVVQVGTSIDINGFPGSVDLDTGVFSATDSAACPSTIAGVVDPSGATFSGTYTSQACDGGGSCATMPQTSPICRTGLTADSVLAVRDRDGDHRDAWKWRWRSAQTTPLTDFGSPDAGDAYALCAYDLSASSPRLAFSAQIPAGGLCPTRPCWRRTQRSLRYRDRTHASDGLGSLLMRGGARTRIALEARGATAPLPSLPAGLPLIVQLQAVDDPSRCWQAKYSQARTNSATVLRSSSD